MAKLDKVAENWPIGNVVVGGWTAIILIPMMVEQKDDKKYPRDVREHMARRPMTNEWDDREQNALWYVTSVR